MGKNTGAWVLLLFIALILMVAGPTGRFGIVLGSVLTPRIVEVIA